MTQGTTYPSQNLESEAEDGDWVQVVGTGQYSAAFQAYLEELFLYLFELFLE